jgi:uncharacterized protein YkwD
MKKRIRFIVGFNSRAGWMLPAVILSAIGASSVYPFPAHPAPHVGLVQSTEAVIYTKVNEIRKKHGLPELTWAADVAEVARKHSKDMAVKGYFAHVNPEGEQVNTRLEKAGIVFTVSAENILKSNEFTEIADESTRRWMESPGHRDNILNADVTETGVGIYKAVEDNNYYITQVFIKRALKIIPAPSRLSLREIDTIFDIVRASIEKSEYEFNIPAVKKRILEELTHRGLPARENMHIEGFIKDSRVLDLTIDIIADNGFIVDFTKNDPDKDLDLYSRLVHPQGYSAAVLINEADGEVRFPLIKIKQSDSE